MGELVYRELWMVIRDQIRDLIISGELASGQRLIETDLAERFQVSRGPVRTALMELERVGLVVSSPRRSSEVATFGPEDLDELYELISGLESLAISRCDGPIGDAALQELSDIQERLERAEAAGDRVGAVEYDLDFHRHLGRLASNGRLEAVWEQHADQMRFVIASVQRVDPTVATKEGEHRHIIDALALGDREAAVKALQEHLDIARSRMARLPEAATR